MTQQASRAAADALTRAIADRVTPGGVIEVGSRSGLAWRHVAGTLTYASDAPRVAEDTWYDLASLTKVIATGSLAMQAATSGALPLDTRVGDRWPAFAGPQRQGVTVEDLLQHTAGFPAHRPYYLTFAGRAAYRAAVAGEPLPYVPRTQSEYTDLGFMVLGWLLEDRFEQPLGQLFEEFAADALGDAAIRFGVPANRAPHTAPTEVDPWRGRVIVGQVHDGNAAALGGAAGHAGLFGTASGVGAFASWFLRLWLDASATSAGVTHATAVRFATRGAVLGSSRARAWDTMLPTSSCGAHFSPTAIGHTGFTGTSLWIDPVRDLYVVLLTNRVHPSSTATTDGIRRLRIAVHDAVASTWPR